MEYRSLGRTGWRVSSVSFGAWAIGGTWGNVDDAESRRALAEAVERGVNFFDTADVYGDGRSERLVGELKRTHRDRIFVATKAGRRLPAQTPDGYNRENLQRFVERSLENLGVDCIDLLQLHCPPTDVYYRPEVFGLLDELVAAGKLRHYGVSIERVEEGLKAMDYPGVQSIQVIYNVFRQRPAELLLPEAARREVGILARLPLSSGVLSGKMNKDTRFDKDDHRAFNRNGEAFDRGETFSGIEYETALRLVDELKKHVPASLDLACFALAWILTNPAVTCVIPGAKRADQVAQNALASDVGPLPAPVMAAVAELYVREIKPLVHAYW